MDMEKKMSTRTFVFDNVQRIIKRASGASNNYDARNNKLDPVDFGHFIARFLADRGVDMLLSPNLE